MAGTGIFSFATELNYKVMGTLSLIVNWFTANKLALNINKTNTIKFALKQSFNLGIY
jgi:hypothetical protein